MDNVLSELLTKADRKDFKEYISLLIHQEGRYFLRNDILYWFRQYCDLNSKNVRFRTKSSIFNFLKKIQELFQTEEHIAVLHGYDIAKYHCYLLRYDGEYMETIDSRRFLDLKDRVVLPHSRNGTPLYLDFMPFYDFSPSIRDTHSIGHGIRFLNRFMSSNIFNRPEEWQAKLFDYLKLHKYDERQLLVNGEVIQGLDIFIQQLDKAIDWLKTKNQAASYRAVEKKLKRLGFEVGWGNTVARILASMKALRDLINEPTAQKFEQFISRVPMPLISNVAIVSPHGWFGQTNVLGKPDTGGQVIYILDQVRALERHLQGEIEAAGLDVTPKIMVLTRLIPEAGDTTCNQKREKIFQTKNGWILRVPFRDKNFDVVKHWISRFKVWPYLETFADDAAVELLSEFQGRPDLIIGNYSDGNLVATLLSDRFDVIQCTIAHALEKTKYLFSDLYWSSKEDDYHFSIQFSADILSMNKSDFIITSTHQEIIGTEDTMGQYESYQMFTMPGFYQVINGINLFAPKFNVIPPGVDEDLYFPYFEKERRIEAKTVLWEKRLFHDHADDIFGHLENPDKPSIFTMARFDKIKNITGLIEAFGMSPNLRTHYNLIFAAGTIHLDRSRDAEEREEIARAYHLIDHYDLNGHVRWLPSINKLETGEVYRVIADHRGLFVQPALFEAFGLTILEAMASGLPTFGPKFGGPLEIIEYDVSGLLLNTSKPEFIAGSLEAFYETWQEDSAYWKKISENGILRVREHFTWRLYSQRLINLSKLYGFWRYSVSGKGKIKMDRYCDFLYHFLIRQRAAQMLEK
jgi:sucrose synthase